MLPIIGRGHGLIPIGIGPGSIRCGGGGGGGISRRFGKDSLPRGTINGEGSMGEPTPVIEGWWCGFHSGRRRLCGWIG